MSTSLDRLGQMCTRDVMTPHVVTLRVDDTLRNAARVLSDKQISGAPVVNESGQLVGVLSATDIVSFELERGFTATHERELPRGSPKASDLEDEDLARSRDDDPTWQES